MTGYKYEAYEKRYVWRNQITGVPVSPQAPGDCSLLYSGDDYTLCIKISMGRTDPPNYVHLYRGYYDGCPQEIKDVAYVGGIWYEPPEAGEGECKIIGDLLYPLECGVGKTFTLNATMRNISNTGGYFIFRVFDGSSEIGASAKTYLSPNTQSGRNITCTMPSHDILLSNGRVELRRQT